MNYKIEKGSPYPLGVHKIEQGIHFAIELESAHSQGIILYSKKEEQTLKIPFEEKNQCGRIYSGVISDISFEINSYLFYQNETLITDVAGKDFVGFEDYGVDRKMEGYRSTLREDTYDWEGDLPIQQAYEDSIIYALHVRGFTKHSSSKVKSKGSFAGVVEKIPYLKELGITTIEILPSYEFEELTIATTIKTTPELASMYKLKIEDTKPRLNYWGFKEGYYFAPKASYATSQDPVKEFKDMVKALHQNNLEIIMEFYFPNEKRQGFILEVLKFWTIEYHIDGFHLMSESSPIELLATEPVLAHTKLLYNQIPSMMNHTKLGQYNENFMCDIRCLLKSDDNKLMKFVEHLKGGSSEYNQIHAITNYQGFTLQDLVSYNYKHNEENGENNQDGTDKNYSWNCGIEGKSRKKLVLALREKQVKNALLLLFLSKGTPLLLSGDEFGNSQEGNNNPYCQDNKVTWINWANQATNVKLFCFVKNLIQLRKTHTLFHKKEDINYASGIRSDYPEISYHGEEAWKPDFSNQSRQLGVMYCGNEKEDEMFYIAYNLHWEAQYFALPKLPNGQLWHMIIDSSDPKGFIEEALQIQQSELRVIVEQRTIQVFIGKKVMEMK